MLEAAMFGIAYEGRMPNFNGMPASGGGGAYGGAGSRGANRPVDPHVLEGRMLREEQELAFQESLEVCMRGTHSDKASSHDVLPVKRPSV